MVLDYSTPDITKNNERVRGNFLYAKLLTALIQCVCLSSSSSSLSDTCSLVLDIAGPSTYIAGSKSQCAC